ncbi:MAG: phosphatase PAP2 family protein [Gaiellaceae bacterium]
MAIIAVVLLAWQAARIPLEGTVETSLAHAGSVRRLEDSLGLDVENPFVRFGSTEPFDGILEWLYTGIHTPALFGFLAAACVYAPERYARLRTIFVVSFLPALLAIGLYPLAPPHWISELGFGPAPEQGELAGSIETLMHNSTAAIASQHFGFAVFIAAASLWLAPRSPIAWATPAYPALVFVVIVGTGNHYVLDCIVGVLTFLIAAAVATLLHGRRQARAAVAPAPAPRVVVGVSVGFMMIVWGLVSLQLISPEGWSNVVAGIVIVGGVAAVLAPRLSAKEPLAESG